jgi:hypothetical protein
VIGYARQWQRCNARGEDCKNLAGATEAGYELTTADEGSRLRMAVLAGNWVSSVSQAFSAPTAVVAPKPPAPRKDTGADGKKDSRSGGGAAPGRAGASAPLRMTRLKLSPRRFAVAHRRALKGTRLDGARISWRLNRPASVKLTFQRHLRRGWVRVGVITRAARAGNGELRFRGRFGNRPLKPQRYRLVVAATQGRERTAARHLGFRVLKG